MKKHCVCMVALCVGLIANVQANTCRVTDPTDTPLNVRNAPNGLKMGTLKNGTVVRASDIFQDEQGRSWIYVYWKGQPLNRHLVKRASWSVYHEGWVIREYISCLDGSLGSKD